jgi:hypothetical protein
MFVTSILELQHFYVPATKWAGHIVLDIKLKFVAELRIAFQECAA